MYPLKSGNIKYNRYKVEYADNKITQNMAGIAGVYITEK